MGEEKKTVMVLKVDLECSTCYKKVKKTLCKFPQIRDQVFDDKANTVTIVVMCCSPEKIRDKLCYKAGKAIKSIHINKEPEKPKVIAEKPKDPEKPKVVAEKPKEPEKPKVVAEKPKEPEKPKVVAEKPKVVAEKPKEPEKQKVVFIEPEKPKSNGKADKPKSDEKPAEKPPKADPPPKQPDPTPKPSNPPPPGIIKTSDPVNGYPLQVYPQAFPLASYCGQCYDGYGGGPCYHNHGFGTPVPPYYDGYGHGPHGGNGVGYVTRYDYLNEDNSSGCSIM